MAVWAFIGVVAVFIFGWNLGVNVVGVAKQQEANRRYAEAKRSLLQQLDALQEERCGR